MKRLQKVELARTLYFKTDKTQKEICEIVGWSENTFTRHKMKECWDEQKAANLLTNDQIISEIRIQAKMITDEARKGKRILTSSEVDSISKIASAIEKMSSKIGLSATIEVGQNLSEWVRKVVGQSKAIEIVELFDAYIKNIIIEDK